jgi:MoaA/NifB/PqqE/SkfB family radical SAM enzyme
MYLNVEITNICNLHCPLCSTGAGVARNPQGMMKLEKFKSFIDKCAPFLRWIGFVGSGEPTLNPKFVEFVEYAAKEKKLSTFCCTNGTVSKNPEAIVKSGLQKIYIDVDGITPQQHELYRVGANLDTVLNNIKSLVQAKKKLRSSQPEIYIDTVISRHNEHDYDGFIEMARQLEVNGIRFQAIKDDLYQTTDWLPTQEKFKHVKKKDNDYNCLFKNTLAGILSWDGNMQLCCISHLHKHPVIKLNAFRENNILERMDSEVFYKLTIKAGNYPFCETCFLKVYSSYEETITFKNNI